MIRISLLVLFLMVGASPLHAAEVKYVTDEFEVTLRSGTSTANSIVRLLRSGAEVTVLENDPATQYSLVETEDGKQGYVLSRFLVESPAAREILKDLRVKYEQQQLRLEQQQTEIEQLQQSLQQEQADSQTLKNTLRASEKELSEVRDAAQNTLNILEQNKRLQTVVDQLREEKTLLSDTNAELSDSTQIDWFVRGAAVSLIAFIIGILVTRIRWRKQDSWGSY
ncbi:MAG: TIGR04211 family SH3 domain-containing protein [Gammaproteobacteria bacterium]|jgi:SH3 domain protein|nr:TIGR04211 family SH3 domain-containing protein [Gammaproteobacteria bacterium]